MPDTIRVLMVDDEDQFRATTSKILKRRGYETRVAATGEEAIKLRKQDLRYENLAGKDKAAAYWLARSVIDLLAPLGIDSGLPLMVINNGLTALMTNLMADGPAAAAVGPISLNMAGLVHPGTTYLPFMAMGTAIASSFAYCLIIGTPPNAIVYACGILQKSLQTFCRSGLAREAFLNHPSGCEETGDPPEGWGPRQNLSFSQSDCRATQKPGPKQPHPRVHTGCLQSRNRRWTMHHNRDKSRQ